MRGAQKTAWAVVLETWSPGHPGYTGVDSELRMTLTTLYFFCNRPTIGALIGVGIDTGAAFTAGPAVPPAPPPTSEPTPRPTGSPPLLYPSPALLRKLILTVTFTFVSLWAFLSFLCAGVHACVLLHVQVCVCLCVRVWVWVRARVLTCGICVWGAQESWRRPVAGFRTATWPPHLL